MYEGFNSRLFDKEEGSIEKSELGESQDSLDDTVTENESVDSQDIDLYASFKIFSFSKKDWLNESQCSKKQLKAFEILNFKNIL